MKRFFLIFTGILVGCVTGKPVPKPTKMVYVEGGVFEFGKDTPCPADVDCKNIVGSPASHHVVYPTMKVRVKSFYIDEHEVTNEQYEYCVEMGACSPQLYETGETVPALKGEPYFQNPKYKDYPVVDVTYEEAQQYCRFVGKRLPTEFEWEYVARGGKNGKLEFPNKYAQTGKDFYNLAQNNSCLGIRVPPCDTARMPNKVMQNQYDVVEIGSGNVYDLTGNVSEWVDGISIYPEGSKIRYVTCDCGDSDENPCLPEECTYNGTWCFDTNNCNTSECLSECFSNPQCPPDCRTVNKGEPCIFRMCGTSGSFSGFPVCKPYPPDQVIDPQELKHRWENFKDYRSNGVVRGCSYAGCMGWPGAKMVCGLYSTNRIVLVSGKDTRDMGLGFRCAKDAP